MPRNAAEADDLDGLPPRPGLDGLGASTAPAPVRPSVEDVLAAAERATGLTRAQLASRVHDRATAAARELVALVVVHRCGAMVTEVGRSLARPADTVSRWLSRGAARRVAENVFERHLDTVEEDLGRQ